MPTLLKITKLGHPILRRGAREVAPGEIASPDTQRLIDDMLATMADARGVGLAACQVHSDLRILVVAGLHDPLFPAKEAVPETVLVNPVLVEHDDEMEEDWEGCLSIPDLRGLTPRWRAVRVSGFDRRGRPVEIAASDFYARVLQHEIDHLDGRVYLDRVRDLRLLGYAREIETFVFGKFAERPGGRDENA